MLVHLPIVILASFSPVKMADSLPKFDIMRECRAEGGSQAVEKRCATDEADARDQLQPQWTQFDLHDRAVCLEATSTDGTPSYVELLTCLEMAQEVRKSSR